MIKRGDFMRYATDVVHYTEKSHPLHRHNCYEVIFYISGKGTLHAEGNDYPVKAGNIAVLPPKALHGTTMPEALQSIYLNGELLQFLNFSAPTLLSDNEKGEGRALAEMIYNNRYGNEDFVSSLCNAYMHFIMQHMKLEDDIGSAVSTIMRKISENFSDSRLQLCDILHQSGYAEDYIRSHFKRITGKTPTAFLTDVRIRHACYLIDVYKNTHQLSEIAEQCGYTDYIYFSRKFKMHTGISPRAYKNSQEI